LLKSCKLYFILDKESSCPSLSYLKNLKGLGIDILQLRDKVSSKFSILNRARSIKNLLRHLPVIFIINDYLDIAKIVDADGIHLGQGDIPISIARRILGKDKIIGISCHSLKEATEAQKAGADYIGIGPVFSTATKPGYKPVGIELLKKTIKKVSVPVFAIGGINLSNLDRVLSTGVNRVALCGLLCKAKKKSLITRVLKKKLAGK
jgi:thiamine-phosphate pyrophosphorylase